MRLQQNNGRAQAFKDFAAEKWSHPGIRVGVLAAVCLAAGWVAGDLAPATGEKPLEGPAARKALANKLSKLSTDLQSAYDRAAEGIRSRKPELTSRPHIDNHADPMEFNGWVLDPSFIDKKGSLNLGNNALQATSAVTLPFHFGVQYVGDKNTTIKVMIPYQWAQKFNRAHPLREQDNVDFAKLVSAQIKAQLPAEYHFIKASQLAHEHYRGIEPTLQHSKARSMKVEGAASPEGKDPASVLPGRIDPENTTLAKMRADVGTPLGIAALDREGIDTTLLNNSTISVKANELQFTPQEWRRLSQLAGGYPSGSESERIYQLVKDYNNDLLGNNAMARELDTIVGSKRFVEITVELDSKKQSMWLVPFPLLALLGAFQRKRREEGGDDLEKDKNDKDKDKGKGGEDPKPEELKKNVPEAHIGRPVAIREIPELVRTTDFPDSAISHKEQWDVLALDIAPNFERTLREKKNEQTVTDSIDAAFSIDYRGMCEGMERNYNRFDSYKEREDALTMQVLNAWSTNDLLGCRAAGMKDADVAEQLDYANQPHQIRQARIHAREMLSLVKGKIEGLGGDYDELLQKRLGELRNGGLYYDSPDNQPPQI